MEYKPRRPMGTVENYTNAFLWSAGVVLFLALFVLWASFGYLASLVTAFFLRLGIDRIPRRD